MQAVRPLSWEMAAPFGKQNRLAVVAQRIFNKDADKSLFSKNSFFEHITKRCLANFEQQRLLITLDPKYTVFYTAFLWEEDIKGVHLKKVCRVQRTQSHTPNFPGAGPQTWKFQHLNGSDRWRNLAWRPAPLVPPFFFGPNGFNLFRNGFERLFRFATCDSQVLDLRWGFTKSSQFAGTIQNIER